MVSRSCIFSIIVFITVCHPVVAQDGCNPNITPSEKSKFKYKKRGNRCEGFYKSPVTEPSLDVVGVLRGKFKYKIDEKEVITLSVPDVTYDRLTVQAQALPLNTYYLMNATLRSGEKLVWPVKDVLFPSAVPSRNISVYGYIERQDSIIYIPLHAHSKMVKATNVDRIRVVLRATVDIEKVLYRWETSDTRKKHDWEWILRQISAGTKIYIPAPVGAKGLCYLWVQGFRNLKDEPGTTRDKLECRMHVKVSD